MFHSVLINAFNVPEWLEIRPVEFPLFPDSEAAFLFVIQSQVFYIEHLAHVKIKKDKKCIHIC